MAESVFPAGLRSGPDYSLLSCAGRRADRVESRKALKRILGVDLPPVGKAMDSGVGLLFRTSPDLVWVRSLEPIDVPDGGDFLSIAQIGDAWKWFELNGKSVKADSASAEADSVEIDSADSDSAGSSGAVSVLRRGARIDLDGFFPGDFALTLLWSSQALLHCRGEGEYEIALPSSVSESVLVLLKEAIKAAQGSAP